MLFRRSRLSEKSISAATTIIREYYNNPERRLRHEEGGFFTLGRHGRFDEEGYLSIVDRRKYMIITVAKTYSRTISRNYLYRHAAVEMWRHGRAPRSEVGRDRGAA